MNKSSVTAAPSSFTNLAVQGSQVWLLFSAVMGTIVGVIAFLIGVWLYRSPETHQDVKSTVLDAKCTPLMDSRYSCETDLKYSIDGKEYLKTMFLEKQVVKGQVVDLQYEISNPESVRPWQPKNKHVAFVVWVIAVLSLIFGWGKYLIGKSYPGAAMVLTAVNVAGALRR